MAEVEYTTAAEVLAAYERGVREFGNVRIERADFRGRGLDGATFVGASLREARLDDARLTHTTFILCTLTGSSLADALLEDTNLVRTNLSGVRLTGAFLVDASLDNVQLTGADLTCADLTGTHLLGTDLSGATLDHVTLGETTFSDMDVTRLCEAAAVVHHGPSYVDVRSVLRSCRHPGLKRFLVDCGVPPLMAEFTIVAAEAEGDALGSLMRSTFISYGGPDEPFARRLYEELRAHGVTTFFFPETARLGRRIGDEVHSRIQEHDRVILVCSRASLDRPGVRNEIQETFDREARDGGATYLIPIRLDDYVLTGWDDPLAARVRDRVVGDFSGAMDDDRKFDAAMSRLLAELRKDPA